MINNIVKDALRRLDAVTGWKAVTEEKRLLLKVGGDLYGWNLLVRKGLRNIHLPMLEKGMADHQPSLLVTDHLLPGFIR